jgi:single-strand DNA-binding protein
MAKDLNKVMMIGRLGTEPELRYTQQGVPITKFRMAVSRQWRDARVTRATNRVVHGHFVNRLAEICSQYLQKAPASISRDVAEPLMG